MPNEIPGKGPLPISLMVYGSREVISTLEELLPLALSGHLRSLAFVAQLGPADHRTGLCGGYSRYPGQALPALMKLQQRIIKESP